MEENISHFQYFVNLFWPWVLGALAVRVICGHFGEVCSWISLSFGAGFKN